HPTERMREAMYKAEVGDDVLGEDPTVRRLEEMAAERMGKEAGLFVVSGTMGNLVSLLAQCGRGEEVVLGDRSHTFLYECGSPSALGGISLMPVPNLPDGTMDLSALEAAVRPEDVHFPRTRLICLENTHNRCCGAAVPPDYFRKVRELADRYGLKVHLDGARIFNASVALGVDVLELTRYVDSVSFCLTKGLCAPVGSVVCGTKEFVDEARRLRKALGGGMRQAGVLAAAGIVALEDMVERLAEDHRRAKMLAEGIAEIPGYTIDSARVRTNMVYFDLVDRTHGDRLVARLRKRGVLIGFRPDFGFRAVTHRWIDDADVGRALDALAEAVREG
ncbi:MAG TPA: aminotransferase class I/II-fold pyridoxal phosphate-dependent enzyme, partial [Candidatus Latescibacteria bacterium]|nr:aminotransferase class I/II-fold pyridoxal phosphate-dependent enzyme [Candidatus Latescibacterota bacterium]